MVPPSSLGYNLAMGTPKRCHGVSMATSTLVQSDVIVFSHTKPSTSKIKRRLRLDLFTAKHVFKKGSREYTLLPDRVVSFYT